MTYQIDLIKPDGTTTTINADDIFDVDIVRPHTAMADFEAPIPESQKALADNNWLTSAVEARILFNNTRLFWGYLEASRSDEIANRSNLRGRGIGRDLKDQEDNITYTATAVEDAIRDFWSTYTGFDATVYPPDVTSQVTDKVVQSATTTSEFQSITSLADSDPVVAQNDNLEAVQTCFTQEAEEASLTGATIFAASRYSGDAPNDGVGEAARFDSNSEVLEITFTPEHDIPASDFALHIRWEANNCPAIDATVNGTTWEIVNDGASFTSPDWRDFAGNPAGPSGGYTDAGGGDFTAGTTYTVRLESTSSGGTSPYFDADVIAPNDSRFTYTFDNTLTDGSDGGRYLSGPELYPQAFQLQFDTVDVPWNVEALTITTTWDDTTNQQELAASNDDGSTFPLTAANSSTLDQSFSDADVGTKIVGRATFSRYGSRTTATPTSGFNGQVMNDWELDYDGSDLPVIDDQTYRGNLLNIAQKLHRRGDYRFAIDHGADDGSGNPTKSVESFQSGTQSKTATYTVENRLPAIDATNYANRVTVRGELRDDGTRPTATAEVDSEIQALGGDPNGIRHRDITRPDLTTLAEVKSVARKEVGAAVTERDESGTLEIRPANVLPGYDYPVDWYNDGNTVQTSLERVQFGQGYQSAEGRLEFDREDGLERQIVESRFERETTKDAL